jgi:hypothetical protein
MLHGGNTLGYQSFPKAFSDFEFLKARARDFNLVENFNPSRATQKKKKKSTFFFFLINI